MIRTNFVRALLLVTLTGCATSHVDPPWSAEDEAALAQFNEAAARAAAAPRPPTAAVAPSPPGPLAAPSGPLLEIYIFNIGQADSMLVIGPRPLRRTLLVDLGEPNGGKRPKGITSSANHVLQRIKTLTGGAHVDYFVLSHYHGDHANGIIKLLSNFSEPFSVGEFIHVGDDGAEFTEPEDDRGVFKRVHTRLKGWEDAHRIGVSSPPRFGPDQIKLGDGVTVNILAFAGRVPSGPPSAFDRAVDAGHSYAGAPANENDYSIALEIAAGDFEMFTAGDLNGTSDPATKPLFERRPFGETYTNVERHLVRHWQATQRSSDVEVYRANHHGSKYSNTDELLDALDPEFVLYSTGAQYGHPEGDAVQRAKPARQLATTAAAGAFKKAGGKVVKEIHIEVALDGTTYTINGETQTARAR